MVYLKVFARLRVKTLPAFARAILCLPVAGSISEVCSRSPYIMDVAFKTRLPDKFFGLIELDAWLRF
jgi:hypothetical protein